MPKPNKALGQKVKEFRLMRQMTQEKAAIFFGVSYATYIRVEQGKGSGDLIRARIEKALNQDRAA
jgi:DNA-binding XRE family transcriptional regulator